MAFIFTSFFDQADKALSHLVADLATLRTGKAHAQLLDGVRVEAYGTFLQLNEVAQITVKDNMLLVSPWDKSQLAALEKAIASAGLNLNPVVDGTVIRIVVPALTEERRKEMVKVLHQKTESCRVMLRTIRTDTKKEIEKLKGTAGVSEDDVQSDLELLEKHTKDKLDKIDQIEAAKEKELMTV